MNEHHALCVVLNLLKFVKKINDFDISKYY